MWILLNVSLFRRCDWNTELLLYRIPIKSVSDNVFVPLTMDRTKSCLLLDRIDNFFDGVE